MRAYSCLETYIRYWMLLDSEYHALIRKQVVFEVPAITISISNYGFHTTKVLTPVTRNGEFHSTSEKLFKCPVSNKTTDLCASDHLFFLSSGKCWTDSIFSFSCDLRLSIVYLIFETMLMKRFN